MYEINIDDVVSGWYGISPKFIKDELKKAKGNPVLFNINSPGGSVFAGIEIFNLIKNYSGKTTALITSLAASMASYIPLVCDTVIAENNAVMMIHNPWTFYLGDYKALEKEAKFLKGLSRLMAIEYSEKSGKTIKEISQLMDDETWYLGQGIQDAGFADETRKTKNNKKVKEEEPGALKVSAQLRFNAMKLELSKKPVNISDYKDIAALLPAEKIVSKNIINPKNNNNGEKKIMNLIEFKAQHPELVEKVSAEAINKELKRVKAHLKFIDGSKDAVVKNIVSGASFMDEEVQASYLQGEMKANFLKNSAADNTNGVNSDAPATPKTKTDAEIKAEKEKKLPEATDENVKKFIAGKLKL